jgi:hypothetical protein
LYSEENEQIGQADWIIDQEDSFILVECKTKRPKNEAYIELLNLKPRDEQLDIIAEAIYQSYRAYINFKKNRYKNPKYSFDGKKKACVCVVTLEPWHLLGNPSERINEFVRAKLRDNGIGGDIITEAPYAVVSVVELEQLSYVLKSHDAFEIFDVWRSKKYFGWGMNGYLKDFIPNYLDGYDYIFRERVNECFNPGMRKVAQEIWGKKRSTRQDPASAH